jgi:hypothetical protein
MDRKLACIAQATACRGEGCNDAYGRRSLIRERSVHPSRYFKMPVRNAALTIATVAQNSSSSKLILIMLVALAARA